MFEVFPSSTSSVVVILIFVVITIAAVNSPSLYLLANSEAAPGLLDSDSNSSVDVIDAAKHAHSSFDTSGVAVMMLMLVKPSS